ncbi:MFS transporter [Curtobacterium sp. ISL-83]|uniref:MFS transporter n=1 Tax=Curtobacterium sp. ISL-83 TaxID=2819145 RepID=UPI001BE848C7|nr:MFS transporter [Curtobacterium sp. ISL-83]MBT2504184.1 MFS transporter [Curtobacterium sp. ISL-83]
MTTDTAQARGKVLWPVAAWFWALQFAVLNPLLAVLLVAFYGATPTEVGWVLGLYNIGAFVASLVIPALADRTRDYIRPLVFCALGGIALVAVLAVTTSLPVVVLALIILGGPPGVGSTLLFAQLRHEGAPPAQVIRTRAIVSFAWVIGPPLATLVTAAAGTPAALALLAGIGVVNVATALLLLRRRTTSPINVAAARPRLLAQLRGWNRWGVVAAFTLLQSTNIATVTIATLFVCHDLRAPIAWAGIILGAAALLEIPALLLLGRLQERRSARLLLTGGWACGVAYYGLAALIHEPWQLLALQPLNAWFFATVAGLGLTVFQDVFPSPGLASGLFTNTRRAGAVLAGLVIAALGSSLTPYRAVYVAAAVIVLAVLITAATLHVARGTSRAPNHTLGSGS